MNQQGAIFLANERGRVFEAGTDNERDIMPSAAPTEPPASIATAPMVQCVPPGRLADLWRLYMQLPKARIAA